LLYNINVLNLVIKFYNIVLIYIYIYIYILIIVPFNNLCVHQINNGETKIKKKKL